MIHTLRWVEESAILWAIRGLVGLVVWSYRPGLGAVMASEALGIWLAGHCVSYGGDTNAGDWHCGRE